MSSQRISAIAPIGRSWQIFKYGGLDQLSLSSTHRTPPIVQPNQVLIKVKATSLNPIDLAMCQGYGASMFNLIRRINNIYEFPLTLGRDFSGTIYKTGCSVKSFVPGMDVIGALWPFEHGSFADYIVCDHSQITQKPPTFSHSEAASIPYAGLTAYSSLVEFGGLNQSNGTKKKVLILGGGGGVGTIAIQIAKSFGAYVMVTCKEHSEEMLLNLGADEIFNISRDLVSDIKFDIIFDCLGNNIDMYGNMLNPGPCSRYVTIKYSFLNMTDQYSPFLGCGFAGLDFIKNFVSFGMRKRGIYQWSFFRASGSNLSKLSSMVDRGNLKPILHKIFKFNQVPEAFETLKSGSVRGKIIIELDDCST